MFLSVRSFVIWLLLCCVRGEEIAWNGKRESGGMHESLMGSNNNSSLRGDVSLSERGFEGPAWARYVYYVYVCLPHFAYCRFSFNDLLFFSPHLNNGALPLSTSVCVSLPHLSLSLVVPFQQQPPPLENPIKGWGRRCRYTPQIRIHSPIALDATCGEMPQFSIVRQYTY